MNNNDISLEKRSHDLALLYVRSFIQRNPDNNDLDIIGHYISSYNTCLKALEDNL